MDEKHLFFRDVASIRTTKTQFSLPRLTVGLMLRRAFSRFIGFFKPSRSNAKPSLRRASFDLRRMVRMRRLVTSVARVLATKPEVIAGIRKRLTIADRLHVAGDDEEFGIYLGDVQDHILNLQQLLVQVQSYPSYIRNLNVDFLHTRAKVDNAGFIRALIGMLGMAAEVPIGMSSTFFGLRPL